jgi:hypothetical protein
LRSLPGCEYPLKALLGKGFPQSDRDGWEHSLGKIATV